MAQCTFCKSNTVTRGGSRKFSGGGGVISQMLSKYDKKASEAREIFFLPPPEGKFPPPLERNLGGGEKYS